MSLNVYKIKRDITNIQKCCHEVLNRVLDLMVKYPKHCGHLNKYAKECLVMERLCDYICNCCCNAPTVSLHIMNECNEKCNGMIDICDNLIKCGLPNKECNYLRCDEMIKLCNKPSSKSSKKSTKK